MLQKQTQERETELQARLEAIEAQTEEQEAALKAEKKVSCYTHILYQHHL